MNSKDQTSDSILSGTSEQGSQPYLECRMEISPSVFLSMDAEGTLWLKSSKRRVEIGYCTTDSKRICLSFYQKIYTLILGK